MFTRLTKYPPHIGEAHFLKSGRTVKKVDVLAIGSGVTAGVLELELEGSRVIPAKTIEATAAMRTNARMYLKLFISPSIKVDAIF